MPGKQATLWGNMIQSPIRWVFTDEQARKRVKQELLRDETGGEWLIRKLGIRAYYDVEYEREMIRMQMVGEASRPRKYHAKAKTEINGRSGYWELVFSHTHFPGACTGGNEALRALNFTPAAQRKWLGWEGLEGSIQSSYVMGVEK